MSRELTREEKRAIRKLVFSLCANYDRGTTPSAVVILVLDKKLSKLLIAPQARQELMRRLLRQTAAKGRR